MFAAAACTQDPPINAVAHSMVAVGQLAYTLQHMDMSAL
jgi:hypothetical protein